MSNFTNDELKNLRACVDLFIKKEGAQAAKVLMPTYDKQSRKTAKTLAKQAEENN